MDGKSVLLVDDSDLVAGMVGEALQEAGFEVTRARDGYEAIEACYRVVPDLIVMDIDMPLLKGYQASRLLKTRRGVRDIPIIMHTANSEDKDRFWSYSSGATAFVVKDFAQIGPLVEMVRTHIRHEPLDLAAIGEDAKGMNRASIAEALSNLLDKELFSSTIMNQLAEAGRSLSSLHGTVKRVLELLDLACERHIGAIVLNFGKETQPFLYPAACVNKEMADDFLAVSLEDYYEQFDRNSLKLVEPVFFNIDERTDWNKISLTKDRLSSYHHVLLRGSGGDVIGSLHIGHLKNNYFAESVVEALDAFAGEAGVIIHNAMLYQRVTTMEQDMRNVFSKFVPQQIIDELLTRKSRTSMLAGEKRVLAILFSDIRSFTTLTEINPPEKVVSFLNRYLEMMCDIITSHGGMVDKFIGDAILAVFGAPQSWPDNGLRAVETALAMSRALGGFVAADIELPPGGLNIGIGVHLGDAIVGTIGSSAKFDYTVIGDTVNLASRLEGLTKQYQVRIIVSDSVVEDIKSSGNDTEVFGFREIERVIVKGKEEPTTILALDDENSHRLDKSEHDLYRKGLSMYNLRNWKTASGYFSQILQTRPDDPMSAMYLERCQEYIKTPPPEDWDLVQRYLTK